jgi:tRNA(Ile)-lysidine synthase
LLTAQHADDQLETVLLQLLRGAGLRGLAAMPAIAPFGRGWIARPLLEMQRAELEAWAHEHALAWVEDATNADEHLDRNYLRRQIVPLLRARWPSAAGVVSRGARHVAEAQRLLDLLARTDVERAAVADALAVTRLRVLPEDRRRNALRYWIVQRGHTLPDARRLSELAGALLAARADAHPEVRWGDTLARRDGDRLSLQRVSERMPSRARARGAAVTDVSVRDEMSAEAGAAPLLDLEWFPRKTALELPAGLGRLELTRDPHGPIDLDAMPEPLTVRLRRGGERLRLTPSGPRRLLKSLLQEARIPRAERARIPLLWSGERLLAAADLWVDVAVRAEVGRPRRGRLVWHR